MNINLKEKTPEKIYNDILNSGDIVKGILFLQEEIKAVNEISKFIKECNNDIEFEAKVGSILQIAKTIRFKKLIAIKDNIRFYQFKRKKYYKKLIQLLSTIKE